MNASPLPAAVVFRSEHRCFKVALRMRKIALTFAILLSVAFTASAASAATKHRRAAQANSPAYNAAASRAFPSGVSLSTACLPTDSPCRTMPDDRYTLANRRPHCLARTRRGGLRHSSLRNWLNRERAASDAGTAAQKESGPIALRGRKVETPKSSLYAA